MSLQFNPFTGTFDVTTKGDTGAVAAAGDGTAAAPGITFASDTNTGIYRPGADQLALSTNGVQRINIEADGDINIDSGGVFYDATNNRLAIGTTPSYLLHTYADTNAASIVYNTNPNAGSSAAAQYFSNSNAGSVDVSAYSSTHSAWANAGRVWGSSGLTGGLNVGTSGANPLIFWTNATERFRCDSSGRLLIGTSSARQVWQLNPTIQAESTATYAHLSLVANSTNAGHSPLITLARTRGTTVGSTTAVQENDSLGVIGFAGAQNSAIDALAASITCAVDSEVGTAGDTTDVSGRLVFSTTADGASFPTERLRITSAGVLQVADAGNIAVGTTTGTKIGTATTQKLGFFNKTPVVQPAAVADATDAASVITQLNALLARMRDLGLIAT